MDKTRIIKSVHDMHGEISEQSAMLKQFLGVFNKKGVWTDVEGIITFFTSSVVRHFLKEDIMFGVLLEKYASDKEKLHALADSIKEHAEMTAEFGRLKEIADKMAGGETELSQEFIDKAQRIMWQLTKHAQVEDLVIYPDLAEQMSEDEFVRIEQGLKNI